MKEICKKLKKDIIKASNKKNLNPHTNSFKPKDLGLKASDYGSFADHCLKGSTTSAKHCGCGLLKIHTKNPHTYFLEDK